MTTVALGQQLIFPVLAVGIVALVVSVDRPWLSAGLLPLPAVAVAHRHAGGAVRHDLRRLAPAEARRPGALPRHGRQRAGADRLSCRRQRRRRSSAPCSARRPSSTARPRRGRDGRSSPPWPCCWPRSLRCCCVLLAAFVGSLLYMVILHHRLKERGLRREEDLLATPLPPDAELPHVVVQIPSFNEGGVLRRGIEAAARLDWPRDKLHIQVLDDSTDETAEFARTVVAELQGARASTSWPCSAPTARASRAAPCTRRCSRRRTTTSPSSTSTTCRRPTSCASACGRSSRQSRTGRSCRRASTSSIRTRTR